MKMALNSKAFSLVELSIVLVILGLLVGGILAGQSLIRASELRSVATDFTRFQTATHAFRDKYFYLPGDLPNATSFWGAAHATPWMCRETISVGGRTCNGDGNGILNSIDGVTNSEHFHYWVHLANAGLVEGAYRGLTMLPPPSTNMSAVELGTNVPASKIQGGGYMAWYCTSGCWMGVAASGKNLLVFGSVAVSSYTYLGILTGEEAWNIDTKLDDGKQTSGRVSATYDVTSCNGNYVLTNQNKGCNMLWALQ